MKYKFRIEIEQETNYTIAFIDSCTKKNSTGTVRSHTSECKLNRGRCQFKVAESRRAHE